MRRLAVALAMACIMLISSQPSHAKLLVASQGDQRILEYSGSDGAFVAQFVSPVTTGFVFPGGIAVSPSDGALYIASTISGEIWSYTTATGLVAPPTVASGLLAPGPMVFDPTGASLYFIAEVPNGPDTDTAIQRLSIPGGSVTTIASDATASFSSIALEGGFLYVSDSLAGTVVRYTTSGGSATTVASGLLAPAGIAFLSPTQMLIAETNSASVVEYHESGGSWSFDREVLAPASGVTGPTGIALAPNGSLTVSSAFSNEVVSIDLTSLAVTTLVPPGSGLSTPGSIVWNGSTLLVASRAGNTVDYFDTAGSPTGITARGLTAPADSGVGQTAAGNLLVASAGANNVTEYDGATGAILRTFGNACPLSFTDPFDVAENAAGDIFVSCAPTDGIRRFDAIGTSVTFIVAGSGGLGSPRGFTIGPNGNFFVSSLTGEVLEYDGVTAAFLGVFVDTTGNGGGPVDPYGLRFHQGSLFVASNFPNEVKEFDATTGAFISTFVASDSGGLSGPNGLAFGPNGDLYVTSAGDDTVKRYNGGSGSYVEDFVSTGSGGLNAPFDLEFATASSPQAVPSLSPVGYHIVVLIMLGIGALRRGSTQGWSRSNGDHS